MGIFHNVTSLGICIGGEITGFKYLTHIQNSVFEGNLSKANSIAMKKELAQYVRKDKDSVIMFHTRDERWLNKDFLGIEEDKTSNFL